MVILYNAICFLISLVYFPVYLMRGKFHRGFLARLGFLPRDLSLDNPIWIHAVSVGEAMAVRGLVRELRNMYPGKKFVISTVTATGNKIAQGIAAEGDFVTYLPLDFSGLVNRVIQRIRPSLFIVAETEIWPNLFLGFSRNGVPIITVNGRISDRSFKGYCTIKFFITPILDKVSLFCVQTVRDAERLQCLGVDPEKIKVTGNMKFDITQADPKKDYGLIKARLGLGAHEKLFVAASTHPGEEAIILAVFRQLRDAHGPLRLLIAPRHPERAASVQTLIEQSGFLAQRLSQASGQPAAQAVFILDTIGELVSFYAIADIVFVGGSFVKTGGHNILEPASLEKPVFFGPHMFNFRDIAELFIRNNAARMVQNEKELSAQIAEFLRFPDKAAALGKAAGSLVTRNQGATRRNAELIARFRRGQAR